MAALEGDGRHPSWPWIAATLVAGAAAILLARALREERLRNGELRARMKEQARQMLLSESQRSQLVTHMSHELRTPLAGIFGLADLLENESDREASRHYLHLLKDSTRSLLVIVDDLLDIGKIESGRLRLDPSPIDPARLTELTVGFLAPRASRKGLILDLSIDPDLPPVLLADPVRLRQILTNLISNAIKFTEKGRIEVTLSWSTERSAGRFEVADTGIGIPDTIIPRLFSPFEQADSSTSRRFGGTGLGLAICKSLVQAMGGTIGVESQRGVGSTFWFEIPFANSQGLEHPDPDVSEIDERHRGRRVLLVEDDPVNRLVASSKLESFGIEVTVAVSGEEALEALRRPDFDLVLMDCQLPGIDGYEATRQFRQRQEVGHRVPVIALTAHSHPDERARCLAAGMNDYLAKPAETPDLFRALSDWLPTAEHGAGEGNPK